MGIVQAAALVFWSKGCAFTFLCLASCFVCCVGTLVNRKLAVLEEADPKVEVHCPLRSWPLFTSNHQSNLTSQGGQDGALEYIFHHIGTTNKFYVEFGFDGNSFEGGGGSNTFHLYKRGWTGLLMDGNHENVSINLRKEFVSEDNIIGLFHKYEVVHEPDYVSVDMDSSDLWVAQKILTHIKPRVLTAEYNCNFHWPLAITHTNHGTWQGYGDHGASLGAYALLAQQTGYVIVDVVNGLDVIFVRKAQ